jgi:uncharacterized glyoxalase superfamily protein PhnB
MTLPNNRSVPTPTVIPELTYPDVVAAVAWLSEAFGFVERTRIGPGHRAQLALGDGALIVSEPRDDQRAPADGGGSHAVMVRVADAAAHCERARAAGATILDGPRDFPYGERQYNAVDFAGHHWTFTQSIADAAPEEWGGETISPW